MFRKVTNDFQMSFERDGGTVIVASVDVWQERGADWQLVKQFPFKNALSSQQSLPGDLPTGTYTCVFWCLVRESLNGRFKFGLLVNGSPTFVNQGDVNTTSAKDDSKVFKSQFVLEVGAV